MLIEFNIMLIKCCFFDNNKQKIAKNHLNIKLLTAIDKKTQNCYGHWVIVK